jgi:twinkle protein
MMDVKTLAQSLAPHAAGICNELYPDGRVESGCYKIGSIQGERGRSMSVYLNGDQCGKWMDFSTGEGGDLLDLIMYSQGMSLVDAMEWSKKRYGIRDNSPAKKVAPAEKKNYTLPKPPERNEHQHLHEYMEKRGFKDVGEVCFRYKIYETDARGGQDVVFPFFDTDGKETFIKTKPINHDGNPSTQKDLKPILFGWQAIPDTARKIWITEGEWDAIACGELGFPALSVPMGGGKGAKQTKWIAHEYENLARFEEILIATDMDEQGELAAAEIMQRLGDRCYRVNLPTKDINELLQKEGYEQAQWMLKCAYEEARWKDPETLRSVLDFESEIDDYFENKADDTQGFGSGWAKLDEEDIKFRPNELWGVCGINGHGKSMWLNQLALNAVEQQQKVLIASMEMTPKATMGRMVRQAAGSEQPPQPYRKKLLEWMCPNLWLFVDKLTPKPEDLMSCFEYAYRRYGITTFVVDSLTNMVRQDDYEGQQRFIEKLVNFKLSFPVTIFIVTHVRKGESEYSAPNKYDVKGSGSITDLADGFISVWKNKRKTEQIEQAEMLGEEPDEQYTKQWDMYLEVLKNRNGMYEGKVGFEFDNKCCQYRDRKNGKARYYINYSKEN